MLLDIQKAINSEGHKVPVHISVKLDNEAIESRGYTFASDCVLDGEMVFEFDSLHLVAKARTKMNVICDKCGEPFELDFKFDIDELFSNDESENAYYGLNPTSIDIDKPLIDNLLFNLPTRLLCKPRCKGLCPVCGKNKNKYECDCQTIEDEIDRLDNPFSKLKKQ